MLHLLTGLGQRHVLSAAMTSVSLGSGDRGRSDWDINLGMVQVEAKRHARKLKELIEYKPELQQKGLILLTIFQLIELIFLILDR